ncbi:hypothetical protein [uncultured Sunxiuqinia sp.]|uniref:hypothetical protein n=1 Tax=uncultured Sunxiuqinia sp. TaxID=1573825 RepID=UPI0026387D37|nr:hypothetical protein [uncultured Sunxiuqinia sp.]
MPRPTTLEVCRKHLYSDIDQVPVAYQERIKRLRVAYTFWYEFPTKTETDIRNHLMSEFGVVKSTAYEDIQITKVLLGDIKNPAKEWVRFQVNAMLDEAYKKAKDQDDAKAMVMAADKKGKYNMLDKPDAEPLPFGEIVPQPFEPTDDPSPLGIKKDPNIRARKKKMLEKYMNEIEIIDVPYEEMINDGNSAEEENIL